MPHYDLDRYQSLLNTEDFAQLQAVIARPLPLPCASTP